MRVSITDPTDLEIASALLFSRLVRRLRYKPFVKRIGLHGNEEVLDFGQAGETSLSLSHPF